MENRRMKMLSLPNKWVPYKKEYTEWKHYIRITDSGANLLLGIPIQSDQTGKWWMVIFEPPLYKIQTHKNSISASVDGSGDRRGQIRGYKRNITSNEFCRPSPAEQFAIHWSNKTEAFRRQTVWRFWRISWNALLVFSKIKSDRVTKAEIQGATECCVVSSLRNFSWNSDWKSSQKDWSSAELTPWYRTNTCQILKGCSLSSGPICRQRTCEMRGKHNSNSHCFIISSISNNGSTGANTREVLLCTLFLTLLTLFLPCVTCNSFCVKPNFVHFLRALKFYTKLCIYTFGLPDDGTNECRHA